ncbi:MAG: hypothetical protein U0T82_14380 [Bacteroidales bacterium]
MKLISPCLAGLVFLLLISCSENEPAPLPSNILGQLKSRSTCHSNKSAIINSQTNHSQSCMAYSYNADEKTLQITHINAGFNCCPNTISATITHSGDTIFISEHEASSLCDCECLYDLEYAFRNVEAKPLTIRFTEPYSGDMEKLNFTIDLSENPLDTLCVPREYYPWGF